MGRVIYLAVDDDPGDLIEVREAAQLLKVSKSSVYAAIRSGRLSVWEREWDGLQMVRRADIERLARFKRRRPNRGQREAG
ncbi:MAG TPA: helix-turn-helix domain-containing protein [Acidimicrobiales bacterium]|nr:helix-turn-helix domain-containing protein [Acidimicrobiales bacterium]